MFRPFTPVIAAAAIATSFAAGELQAKETVPYRAELSSCIEGIYDQIELADANRVRHVVVDYSRDIRGYELTIETTVFRGKETTEFSAACLARGELRPFRLRVRNQGA